MHTKFLEEKEITRRARRACEDIQRICSSGDAFTLSGTHRDPVQTLVIRRGSNKDGLITPIIEASAIQAEKKAAGAGELFLRIFSNTMIDDISRRSIGLDPDDEWEKIQEKITKFSIPARKRDIEKIFSTGSPEFRRITREVFSSIRSNDNILVKKTAQNSTRISREDGYSFSNLEIDQRFLSKGSWIRKNSRVILIDGIIEKVSEIHHFLEEISCKKTPSVIFCIDSLPEVTETLVKNYMLGNLDVMMVKVPVNEFHVNTLADLGVIFEASPIAAARGDTIFSGIQDQNIFADRISILKSQISIEREKGRDFVLRHLSDLRKRIEEDINLMPILEPRIRSLSASTTRIDVGVQDQKKDPNIIERLDRTFRSLPKILKSGFIEKNDFEGFSSSKISLLFEGNNVVPAEMAHQAIKIFLSTRSSIRSAAAGIESV